MESEFEKHRDDYEFGMRHSSPSGFLEYNNTQYEHFVVQPLLQAIIIIIEKPFGADIEIGSQIVRLLKTGREAGLSGPISFENFGLQDANIVVVSFDQAMGFLMELEDREWKARPCTRDSRIVDKRSYGHTGHDFKGFEGPIVGTSTSWIQNSKNIGLESLRPIAKLTEQSKNDLDEASGGRTLQEMHPNFFQ